MLAVTEVPNTVPDAWGSTVTVPAPGSLMERFPAESKARNWDCDGAVPMAPDSGVRVLAVTGVLKSVPEESGSTDTPVLLAT